MALTQSQYEEIAQLNAAFAKLTITEEDDPTISRMLDNASAIVERAKDNAEAQLVSPS